MHQNDFIVVILYFISVVLLGLYRNKKSPQNSNNYILNGRKLSLPGFVATLVTTWYGGILGIGENTYNYGIQTWFIFAFPYYIFAILFAMFIAPRIRQKEMLSIPDHFSSKYGRGSGIVSGIFILFLASPAPYILSIGILLEYLTGLSFLWSLLLAAILSLVYLWRGGFGAVVRTDVLQFILMFGGFILLVSFAWYKIGSPLEVFATLPKDHLSITGGKSISYILVWFFIALWTFIDPGFYQRCAASKSPRIAKKGIMISVIFWFIFDALTLTSGLYARAAIDTNHGLFAFPAIGEHLLPPIFYGLFIVGILATIMSTIDSLGFISAFTFGKDIIGKTKIKQFSTVQLTKMGLIVMAAIAIILAYALPSVVSLWYLTGSILVPGLLIPFILTFTKLSMSNKQGMMLLIFPMCISLSWYLISIFTDKPTIFSIEPFYPGMLISVLLTVFIIYTENQRRDVPSK